jgi:putative oxidoreductase
MCGIGKPAHQSKLEIIMFMQKYDKQIYSLMRIIVGFLFLWHGSQKLFGFPPAGGEIPFHVVAIGGTVEFFGGLLVCLGLFTRWAAFLASGEMAYAYWTVHAFNAVLPILNHGESAMVYCFLFLFIAAHGPGLWSLDHWLRRQPA